MTQQPESPVRHRERGFRHSRFPFGRQTCAMNASITNCSMVATKSNAIAIGKRLMAGWPNLELS
jgi:hypothetical protein